MTSEFCITRTFKLIKTCLKVIRDRMLAYFPLYLQSCTSRDNRRGFFFFFYGATLGTKCSKSPVISRLCPRATAVFFCLFVLFKCAAPRKRGEGLAGSHGRVRHQDDGESVIHAARMSFHCAAAFSERQRACYCLRISAYTSHGWRRRGPITVQGVESDAVARLAACLPRVA